MSQGLSVKLCSDRRLFYSQELFCPKVLTYSSHAVTILKLAIHFCIRFIQGVVWVPMLDIILPTDWYWTLAHVSA